MDKLSLSVFTLFMVLVPVSCTEGFFAEPVICYFLDGILMLYCIVATALFFREKFPRTPPVAVGESAENGCIYQELERPKDADPYEVLEPTKKKKKAANKKKSESAKPGEKDLYESLSSPAPPLRPPQSPR